MDESGNESFYLFKYTLRVQWFYFIILVLPYLIFLILPADYFDKGESVCPSILLFNAKCSGCGLTRAVMHLIHFQISKALEYNKYVLLWVFPVFILYFPEVFFVGKNLLIKKLYYPFDYLNFLIPLLGKIKLWTLIVAIISILIGLSSLIIFILIKYGYISVE